MSSYLDYTFNDDESFVGTFDEAPLWSAAFGLLLLKHLELKPNLTVLDVGSGAGFPLMELAARLGNSSKLYGIDPWKNANSRARQKIINYGLTNVEIIECNAEKIPFEDGTIDLIVSNLGINNFENPEIVFTECRRVLKPGGKIAFTTNCFGHWKEFYTIFYSTLEELGKADLIPGLKKEEEHRGTIASITQLMTKSGMKCVKVIEDQMTMQFLNGSAFLNHYFVKLGWLTTWLALFPKEFLPEIFNALENNLNGYAAENGGLQLTVPMGYFEGQR